MNKQLTCVLLAIFGLVVVTSSPVYPIAHISEMDTLDICLFICNICYHKNEQKMLHCANQYCLGNANSPYSALTFLWIGNTCDNWDGLRDFLMQKHLKH